jgi:molybdopterin/thiamine biosynthesis adenylyltransferase/rhodanese-related sulfurtransferase
MMPQNMARYSRQLIIPEIGLQGQLELLNSKVLVVGAGGLGCPVLLYLAAAGIGRIGIADFDRVDLTNLQRQILYSETDVGKSKVECAASKLLAMNSDVKIDSLPFSITKENVLSIVGDYDVVLDASDSFITRYVLNDACYIKRIPLIYGSLFRLEGQVSVFNLNEDAPCYRCLYASPPPANMIPNCSEGGALGAVAGIIGSIQAAECVKVLLNKGNLLSGKMMHINLLDLDFSFLSIHKSPSCRVCSLQKTMEDLDPAWYEFDGFKHICTRIKHITGKQLMDALKTNSEEITLINVKETWENIAIYTQFNELSIPLSTVEADLESVVGLISHQGKNIFYCTDGSRSEQAISILEEKFGYTNLYNFKGNPQILFD